MIDKIDLKCVEDIMCLINCLQQIDVKLEGKETLDDKIRALERDNVTLLYEREFAI